MLYMCNVKNTNQCANPVHNFMQLITAIANPFELIRQNIT